MSACADENYTRPAGPSARLSAQPQYASAVARAGRMSRPSARALLFRILERRVASDAQASRPTRSFAEEAHMTMYRSTVRMFSVAVPLLIGGAPALMAQGRNLFSWTGRVDREVQISMRGRDVWTNGIDRDDGGRSRLNVASALPRTDGYVRVQAVDGRGDVSVVQQPSAYNNYTTIVRVRDRSSGSDRYRLNAYWESRYSDNRGGNGGYGRQSRDGGDDGNGSWGRDGDSRDGAARIDPGDRSKGRRGDGGSGHGRRRRGAPQRAAGHGRPAA